MGNTPTGKRRNSEAEEKVVERMTVGSNACESSHLPPRKKFIMQASQEAHTEDTIMRILGGDSGVADVTARLQSACLQEYSGGVRQSPFTFNSTCMDTEDATTPRGHSPAGSPQTRPPWSSNNKIPERIQPKTLPTVFKWEGGGREVYLSGSFNNWSGKIPMVKSTENFYTIIDLPEGEHRYKFIVDGQWKVDSNQELVLNCGTITPEAEKQNVIYVRSTDFDVREALLQDMAHSKHTDNGNSPSSPQSRRRTVSMGAGNREARDAALDAALNVERLRNNHSPPGEYSQEIPEPQGYPPSHSRGAGGSASRSSGQSSKTTPPLLPPHLMQVILNKNPNSSGGPSDPCQLPNPNHVMVNHMYALQIKDGVIVLSAITRYRKKTVSTVVYKPV